MLKNNWRDRLRIREDVFHPLHGTMPGITPVLLSYWTTDSLEQFLVPCNSEELGKLIPLHGVDENDEHSSGLTEGFEWLKEQIYSSPMMDEGGVWYDRYLIDRSNPPMTLPPGTMLVTTGFIPQEHEGRNPIYDFVDMVEKTGGLVRDEDGLDLAGAEDCQYLAESYVLACKHLGKEPLIRETALDAKEDPDQSLFKVYEYSSQTDCLKSGRHLSDHDQEGYCALCGFLEKLDT